MFKEDVKQLLKYLKQYQKENPDAKVSGIKGDVKPYATTKTLETFVSFVEWLKRKDPEFIEDYAGGSIINAYNRVKNERRAFIKAVDKYKAKYVKSSDLRQF